MSSRAGGRVGRQEPRVRVEPASAWSDGADAAELGRAYGLDPFPWERLVLDSWLARDALDDYSAKTAGLACPRQNGKNAIVELRELYGMATAGERVLHTAHEVKTARKAFLRLSRFFEDEDRYPELAEMLAPNGIRRTNGQESIALRNGGSIEFSARSRGANRGYTVDVVVFDEAQELTDEQQAAIMYAMGAAPSGHRQLIYLGTPPAPTGPGEVFLRVRSQALSDDPPGGLAWHEWGVTEVGDVTDRDRWYETNPSMGLLLTEEWTANELLNSRGRGGEAYFARERLGWWAEFGRQSAIPMADWDRAATKDPPADGVPSYGVKFSPDGAWVSLAVCLRPPEGPPHVEVVEHRSLSRGIDWLGEWLCERRSRGAAFVVDGRSNQSELVAQMAAGGVPRSAIVTPSARDVVAAATRFASAVQEGRVTHYAQQALDECVRKSRKRPIGRDGGWGWDCWDGDDASPLEAVSLAYWGAMTTRRVPGRKVRVV